MCIDGRYGDVYHMSNPETLRLCLKSTRPVFVPNHHANLKAGNYRVQNLEVVRVSRDESKGMGMALWYNITSAFGWLLLLLLLIGACIMELWPMVSFLVLLPMTGAVIFALHGGSAHGLSSKHGSSFNRIVVVAQHMNETDWQVFYGESSLVNALLNVPLRQSPRVENENLRTILYAVLRVLILAQWAAAIGAAVTKSWDAYGITFWVIFCIISRVHMFSPEESAKIWLKKAARVQFARYWTKLSSRRALLNTIMALNPDTFEKDTSNSLMRSGITRADSLLWIDPILKTCSSRTRWEEASRLAMIKSRGKKEPLGICSPKVDTEDVEDGHSMGQNYEKESWYPYISEGINIAAEFRRHMSLKD